MTIWELTDCILYLRPEGKFSVWDTTNIEDFMGEGEPIPMDNKLIDWQPTNTNSCPTWNEIESLDLEVVKAATDLKIKQQKYEAYKSDKNIIANYKVAQMIDPNISWTNFIDKLDEEIE